MDFSQLDQRLRAIEARLAQLEQRLDGIAGPEAPVIISKPAVLESPVLLTAEESAGLPKKQGNWLGFIASICFVLAAAFIIKLSVDSGWLNPERQIGLAYLLGFILIGGGFALQSLDKPYASLLPATGIIVLYLSNFAAHRLYFLILFPTALVITSLISIVCIILYLKFRHEVYALVAAIGSYLAPVILDINANALFSLYYFLICSLTYATIAIWVESRTLLVIAAYLAILVTGVTGLGLQLDGFIALVLALHFMVFSIGTYLYSKYNELPMSEGEAWAFFPVLLVFYAFEYFYIDRVYPGLAPWISLGFSGLLIGLYLSAKTWFPNQAISSKAVILAFTTVVFFHSFYLELLPNELRPWLFVLIFIVLAYLPLRLLQQTQSTAYYIPGTAVFIILAMEYGSMLLHLFGPTEYSWLIVSFASFLSLWFFIFRQWGSMQQKKEHGFILLLAAHVLGVSGLYQLFHETGSLAVSASWLLYAIVVIAYAYGRRDPLMAKSALLILSLAAGKALIYDSASTPTIVRILCLLLTGVVLYGCGMFMKRIASWEEK